MRCHAHSLVLLAGLLRPSLGRAATVNVPGDYPTIQDAVLNAPDGSAIQIAPGRYPGQVRLENGTKSLTIQGNPADPSAKELLQEHWQKYFEGEWIHKPRKSLGGATPVDASGHPQLRKKLLGIIGFVEECAALGGSSYDFDRLRRRLQLPTKTGGSGATPELSSMSAAALAGLALEELRQVQVAQPYCPGATSFFDLLGEEGLDVG